MTDSSDYDLDSKSKENEWSNELIEENDENQLLFRKFFNYLNKYDDETKLELDSSKKKRGVMFIFFLCLITLKI